MLPTDYQCEGQMTIFDFLPQLQSGKMSQELSVQEFPKEEISDVSSRSWQESKTLKFQYLCLTKGNGCRQDVSKEMIGAYAGEPTMPNFGEFRSEEEESASSPVSTTQMLMKSSFNCSEEPTTPRPSKLSQILELNANPKYFLSAKACQGILRRAENKGRQLPELLDTTLRTQSGLSVFKNEPENPAEEKDSSLQKTESAQWEQAPINTLSIEGNGARPSHHGQGWSDGAMYTLNAVEHHSVLCVDQGAGKSGANVSENITPTLATTHGGEPCIVDSPKCLNLWDIQSKHIQPESGKAEALYSGECRGGGGESYVMQKIEPAIAFDRAAYNQGQNAQYNFSIEEELAQTIVAKGPGGVMHTHVVRRLTPMECERLQGYPDGWTDIGEWTDSMGKVHKPADSCRYKALGNSIALPFWAELAKAVVSKYEHPITLGSLFDGIGGFPLVFERAGAKAIWASEIEEFPIAVTKRRFPDGEE